MAKEDLPAPEDIRKLLRYEPDTGKLYWLERTPDLFEDGKQSAETVCRRWNTRYAGKEALTSDNGKGYRQGAIFSRVYFAHRVIWAIAHNEWPADQIDHINGVKNDNRIENLRAVTNQENHKNQKLSSNNTSGVTGVYWRPARRKWQVRIYVNGRLLHLGLYVNKDEAVAARKAAEVKYGFHENHGRG